MLLLLLLLLFLDTTGKQLDQLALDIDLNGSVMQDLPITVPAAAGRAVVRCLRGVCGIHLRLLWGAPLVFWRNHLLEGWLKVKFPHPMDLHE